MVQWVRAAIYDEVPVRAFVFVFWYFPVCICVFAIEITLGKFGLICGSLPGNSDTLMGTRLYYSAIAFLFVNWD